MLESGPVAGTRGTVLGLVLSGIAQGRAASAASVARSGRGFKAAHWLQRALPTGLLALALVGVPVLVFQPEGLPRMRTLSTELAGLQEGNDELKREIGVLRSEVADLRDNPLAVERIARDQLGLVKKNEVVLHFGSTPRAPTALAAPAPATLR